MLPAGSGEVLEIVAAAQVRSALTDHRNSALCYVMLRYVMRCYAMLRYAMLCCAKLF